MALVHPSELDPKAEISPTEIQKLIEENELLMKAVLECENRGRHQDCEKFLTRLHQNMVYLGEKVDLQNLNALEAQTETKTNDLSKKKPSKPK